MDDIRNSMGTNNPNATRDQYGDLVRLQVSGRRLITEDRENALLQDMVFILVRLLSDQTRLKHPS